MRLIPFDQVTIVKYVSLYVTSVYKKYQFSYCDSYIVWYHFLKKEQYYKVSSRQFICWFNIKFVSKKLCRIYVNFLTFLFDIKISTSVWCWKQLCSLRKLLDKLTCFWSTSIFENEYSLKPCIHRMFPCAMCPCSLVIRHTKNESLLCLSGRIHNYDVLTEQNKDSLSEWRVTREEGHTAHPMDTGPKKSVFKDPNLLSAITSNILTCILPCFHDLGLCFIISC